ncbi:rhomboid family intramembrane serine protease [Candidatus Pacearchaeota archaeon]|nr:rhomboid family intramembrane serine protease [Candidatus Pacearchaeota archaeon]
MVYYSLKPYKKRSFFWNWFSNLNTTGVIIFINVLCFILAILINILVNSVYGVSIYTYLGLQANSLFLQGYAWTLLTSMFLHVDFFHLFVNMFSLYFIGSFVEMIIGKKRFISFYLISGIIAGVFFCVLAFFFGFGFLAKIFTTPDTYAVGASGAIFALAGLLAVLTPKNRVYLIVGPIVAIILQTLLQSFLENNPLGSIIDLVIMVYIFFSIFSVLSPNPLMRKIALPLEMPFWILPIVAIVPLVIIGLFFELPIGNMAHLGGAIVGIAYGFYLRTKYKKKTQMISRYFSK